MTVVYVSSAGGVLLDVLAIDDAWQQPCHWVAVRAADTREALADAAVDWVDEPVLRFMSSPLRRSHRSSLR